MKLHNEKNDKCMRAINFDLSIKKLEKYYSTVNPKGAYKDIRDFFTRNGFEHRQGSGYCSKAKLSNMELLHITDKMFDEMTWLNDCSKKIDVTNIGEIYDIKKMYSENQHKMEQAPNERGENKRRSSPQEERKSVLQRLAENKKIVAQNTKEPQDKIHHREKER